MSPNHLKALLVGLGSLLIGYYVPALHRSESGPSVMLGEYATPDPRLDRWLDFRQFQKEAPQVVVRQIADLAGLQFDVDWDLVKDISVPEVLGYDPDHLWTTYGTVEQALDALFSVHDLSRRLWHIDGDTLVIRSPEDLSARTSTVTHIYDIVPTFPRLKQAGEDGGGPFWYDRLYIPPGGLYTPAEWDGLMNEQVSETLARLISDYIAPDTWNNNRHRAFGEITTGPGFLIVKQTPENHRRIDRLIHLLSGEQ